MGINSKKETHECASGWWFQLLWKIWKSVGMMIPNLLNNKSCMLYLPKLSYNEMIWDHQFPWRMRLNLKWFSALWNKAEQLAAASGLPREIVCPFSFLSLIEPPIFIHFCWCSSVIYPAYKVTLICLVDLQFLTVSLWKTPAHFFISFTQHPMAQRSGKSTAVVLGPAHSSGQDVPKSWRPWDATAFWHETTFWLCQNSYWKWPSRNSRFTHKK